MDTSGTPSPIRISQKRLTAVLAGIALIGTLTLSLTWWDSVENITAYSTQKWTIMIGNSAVGYTSESLMSLGTQEPYWRGKRVIDDFDFSDPPLFPLPEASSDFISIPIYLLILFYLATLLLIWIVLMNRLARHDFTKVISIPKEE